MLPTVEQVHVARTSFPRWRVDARTQSPATARAGDGLRVLVAAPVRGTWPMSFLPLRARKAVVAGSVRDGPLAQK